MCTTDVSAAYGSVIAGASGFAQLVGVACSGTCYAEASRWSAVAISHGDAAVEDAAACRALCASTQLCEVWTHDDGECRLMRAMDASTTTALGGAAELAPPVEELACTLDALGAIGVVGAAEPDPRAPARGRVRHTNPGRGPVARRGAAPAYLCAGRHIYEIYALNIFFPARPPPPGV